MDPSRVDGVKAPQHRGTPRYVPLREVFHFKGKLEASLLSSSGDAAPLRPVEVSRRPFVLLDRRRGHEGLLAGDLCSLDDGRFLLDRFFLGRRREGLLAGEGVVELLVADDLVVLGTRLVLGLRGQ